jgi:hypothetical protein
MGRRAGAMKEIQIPRNEIQIFRNEIQAGYNKIQIRRNEIQIQTPSISFCNCQPCHTRARGHPGS